MKSAFLAIAIMVMVTNLQAQTLSTSSFTVKIKVNCKEGNVTCENVIYNGISKKTGKTISLKGRTMHSKCADGVTPCHFQGYIFKSGTTSYTVMEDGELIVMRGTKLLLQERGKWEK